jgi:hypothetical protein
MALLIGKARRLPAHHALRLISARIRALRNASAGRFDPSLANDAYIVFENI